MPGALVSRNKHRRQHRNRRRPVNEYRRQPRAVWFYPHAPASEGCLTAERTRQGRQYPRCRRSCRKRDPSAYWRASCRTRPTCRRQSQTHPRDHRHWCPSCGRLHSDWWRKSRHLYKPVPAPHVGPRRVGIEPCTNSRHRQRWRRSTPHRDEFLAPAVIGEQFDAAHFHRCGFGCCEGGELVKLSLPISLWRGSVSRDGGSEARGRRGSAS